MDVPSTSTVETVSLRDDVDVARTVAPLEALLDPVELGELVVRERRDAENVWVAAAEEFVRWPDLRAGAESASLSREEGRREEVGRTRDWQRVEQKRAVLQAAHCSVPGSSQTVHRSLISCLSRSRRRRARGERERESGV